MLIAQTVNSDCDSPMEKSPFFKFSNKMESSLAEIVDLSSSEATGTENINTHFPKDPESLTIEETINTDTKNLRKKIDNETVFWVPAQLHPEIAPNEFNTWLDKRASALSPTEKRATRRKSILSISSITSDQLEEYKDTLEPLPENNFANLNNPIHRRRTLNDSNKKAELLVKKDKDNFIVVPKAEKGGLKRSARIKPRKDGSGKGYRRQLSFSNTEIPNPQDEEEIINHRKSASMSLPNSSKAKSENSSESSLLSEIASLLSIDLFDKQAKSNQNKSIKISSPSNFVHTSGKSLEAEDVPKNSINDADSAKLSKNGLTTSKSNQDLTSLTSIDVTTLLPISRKDSRSSESTLLDDSNELSLTELAQTTKKNTALKAPKKGFSWFKNNDSDNVDKKANKQEKQEKKEEEGPKAANQVFKPSKLSNSTNTNQKSMNQKTSKHSRNKSNNIRDILGDGISSDVNVTFNSSASKMKNKDKSKKMNFFFLSKDKDKSKSRGNKEKNFISNDFDDDTVDDEPVNRNHQSTTNLSQSKYDLYDPTDLPLHVEQSLYRLSHQKLSNPRRPLLQQVIISNLMLAYLRVVNPNFRSTLVKTRTENIPKPRSPHLLSKERYKSGRHNQLDSSSDEDDLSFSDSSSDDESLSECLNRSRSPKLR